MKADSRLLSFLIILCINSFALGQHKKFHELYHPGDLLYVHAQAGLSLRQSADPKGTVLTVVAFGEKVQVLPFTTQAPFSNSGINGVWVKVTYGNFQGYQFSGFLSRYPVTTGDQPDTRLKSVFTVKKEVNTPPDNRNYNEYLELYFTNGIVLLWSAPEGGNEVTITFPESQFTYQEVYLYAKEIRSDFFANGKCPYIEDHLDCSTEYSSISIKYTGVGDKFHPVPAMELDFGDAD